MICGTSLPLIQPISALYTTSIHHNVFWQGWKVWWGSWGWMVGSNTGILFVPGKYDIILTLRAESLLYSYFPRNKQMWRLSQTLKQLYWSLPLDLEPHWVTSKGVVIATPFNVQYLYQAEHQCPNLMETIMTMLYQDLRGLIWHGPVLLPFFHLLNWIYFP